MGEHCLGSLFIVAAPSGGGKTSLVKKLVQDLPNIQISVSHTTRNMRPGEVDGIDYFFVKQHEFQEMIDRHDFVEYAHVFNHLYGTSVAQINSRLEAGIDVLLDIDWQGAQQIKRLFSDAVSIFIIPPSLDALKQRLMDRGQDDEQVICQRMQRARDELSHFADFDYMIVNDDFDEAACDLEAIIVAHRLKIDRQCIKLRELLSFLMS